MCRHFASIVRTTLLGTLVAAGSKHLNILVSRAQVAGHSAETRVPRVEVRLVCALAALITR
jgi:hypothetical protein